MIYPYAAVKAKHRHPDRWDVIEVATGKVVHRYLDVGLARRMAVAMNREALAATRQKAVQ